MIFLLIKLCSMEILSVFLKNGADKLLVEKWS